MYSIHSVEGETIENCSQCFKIKVNGLTLHPKVTSSYSNYLSMIIEVNVDLKMTSTVDDSD